MKVLLLAERLMFKADGMKLGPSSSQRCTVAGAEAMDQAAYQETLSRRKEKTLPPRVTQQMEQVPWDSHPQRSPKLHGTRL